VSTICTSGQTTRPALEPPVAATHVTIKELHGRRLADEYAWLREKENPEVRAYLEAENAYADAVMKPTETLQKKLYEEMLGRIQETDVQVPYREGQYLYYARTEAGKQYPILCRKPAAEAGAPEQVTLDVNRLAEGQSFMSLGAYSVSDDGRMLAYSTDNTGFRQYTLHLKDLETGETLSESIENTGPVAWANDNRTLFYTVEDAAKRQYRLYRHTAGSLPSEDRLVYEETDERFNLHIHKSRSRSFLFLESGSHTTAEFRYLPAGEPAGEWRLLEPRQPDIEYYPEHHGDFFYLRVNDTGRNYRLVKAPIANPDRQHWQEVLPHRSEAMLEHVEFFQDFYVVLTRADGLQQIDVTDLHTGASQRVRFPEPAYSLGPENNREFATDQYRYAYMSFITPLSVYDYDVAGRRSELLKRTEVLGGYDPGKYRVERVFATAADGVSIAISLVCLRTVEKDGSAPVYLYGYGAYGIPMDAGFNSNRFSLIDRGAIFAVAHIRGGGDWGKAWHDDGRMMKKMNSFTDFIACAEYLTQPLPAAAGGPEPPLPLQYGDRNNLVIEGSSAGGLLMGAVVNLRPELFRAIVAKVPFLDVINTMLDESLPLTVGEFEEWGNPKQPEDFAYMIRYSPYDNLRRADYPAMLIKTSFHDSQVMYWEPAKYVARLRTLNTGSRPLLLKTNLGAGHGGSSGRYDYLREIAFDYAFVLTQMGVAGASIT